MSPVTGHTRVFGLVGHPVAHSLSPALHNAWFAHHDVDAVYVSLPAPSPRDLAAAVRDLGLAGVNVTVPHKAALLEHLDALDETARAVHAVNTVVRDGDRLVGHNTDASGFAAAVDELGIEPGRVLVLGAGGAARAVARALVDRHESRVILLNRDPARAEVAAARLGHEARGASLTPEAFTEHVVHADLIINALPGGARQAVLDLPVDAVPPGAAWIDLNYWDAEPPHLAHLARRGHATQTGHAMLLHQAAHAFRVFTGLDADLDVGRAVLTR